MKFRSVVATSATAVLAVGGVTMMAAPAQADLVTTCSGHGGAITLPTDLVVPTGESCYLDGTTVQGDVTVNEEANLHIVGGEIEGEVMVEPDGYFDSSDSSLAGEVTNKGSYGTYLENSTGEGLNAVPVEDVDNDGFVYVIDSSISSVAAEVGGVYVSGSRISQGAESDGAEYTDIVDSVLRGDLTVNGSRSGGILCDSEVLGAVSYTDGAGPVAVGAGEQENFCDFVNYIDGDLTVTDISGGAYIDNNIIGGALVTENNSPVAEVGDNNRVRGDLDTEEVALSTFGAEVMAEFEAHEAELEAEVEELRSETIEEALESGPAF